MKFLIMLSLVLFSTCLCAEEDMLFTVEEAWFTQHIVPDTPEQGTFEQQYFILIPKSITDTSQAKIHFILGNENDATAERLIKIYTAYGSPQDTVFAIAEHRGYGQSTTSGSQQTPDYVSLDAAVHDNARLIRHLRETFQGQWIVNGCSYGGSLAIRYAELHPDTYDVAISSSAVIDYPAMMPQYADMVNRNLSPELVARLAAHIQDRYEHQDESEAMRQMELIHTLISGMTQVGTMQYLITVADYLSYLPTSWFVGILDMLLPPAAHNWANGQSSFTVPSESTQRNWYVWKYQMCHELGTFWTGYPYAMTQTDYVERCTETFGSAPYFDAEPVSYATSLANVKKPIIVISGGKDPWINVGVQPDHNYTNIEYIYDENWHHCPDKDTPEATAIVKQKLTQLLAQ